MAKLHPICPDCHSELKVGYGFTGAAWDSEAGDGSGFGWEISLDCTGCDRIFPLGFVREYGDFSQHRSAMGVGGETRRASA